MRFRVEYWTVRALEALARAVPRSTALAAGRALGWLAHLLRVRRSVVVANLRHVGLGAQMSRIVPRLYSNMGMYLMDILRAPAKPPPHRFVGEEVVSEVNGRGAIALLAHFGNFELLASIFGTLVGELHVIFKPAHNPLIDRWLEKRRQATGVRTIPHKNAARKALGVLRRHGVLAALIDQHPGKDGTVAPFLEQPALTTRAIAGLQVRTRCPLVSAYALLGDGGVYDVVVSVESTEPGDVASVQKHHNAVIEAWVQKYPEHWFGWFHRRFRPFIEYSSSETST